MNLLSRRFLRAATLALVVIGLVGLALGGYLGPLYRYTINPLVGVQSWLSSRYMAFYDFLTVPRDVASLRERNVELESEVSRLQAQVVELQQQISELQVLSALVEFARTRPENRYIAAAVIGRDPSPFLHYIIIDHGSDSGLKHGMPVVTQQGLVGRIDAVTSGAARVQLITDPGSAVNVRLQTSQRESILQGSITGDLSLEMIPQDITLQQGEVILTSGLGGSYPANLFVGQVVGVRRRESDLFQTASVQSVVDFSSLKVVLVITNFKPVDIAPLVPTPIP
ncbi:MAG: rod shape-determining protein MreC [Chloroflexi bacterium]|nr:rod shape-determining protein MreC [Chloroflexota bacterium]